MVAVEFTRVRLCALWFPTPPRRSSEPRASRPSALLLSAGSRASRLLVPSRQICSFLWRGSVSPSVQPVDHDESVRLYGPWRTRTPRDAADLLDGYGGRWWIAGGWAIEAFTGIPRPHDDLDPSIPRSDVPALRQHLSGLLDVWQAADGALRPMTGSADPLAPSCGNLWLRPDGGSAWEYDVILMDATSTTWTYKRDQRISLPMDDILWRSTASPT